MDGVKETIEVEKVFISLIDGQYAFKKKKILGKREDGQYRIQFVCCGCEKVGKFISCYATVLVENFNDEKTDVCELDDHLCPKPEAHECALGGADISDFQDSD